MSSSSIYSDENIVVFATPLPSRQIPTTRTRKRRRSSSTQPEHGTRNLDGDSKTTRDENEWSSSVNDGGSKFCDDAGPSSSPQVPTEINVNTSAAHPIALDWKSPKFCATSLSGSKAQEWRRLVIGDMFPGSAQRSEDGSQHRTPSSIASSRPRRRKTPAWSLDRLPRPPLLDPTSIAYLTIGPKVRGRFHPELAKKQGVKPGPDFGRLAAGERVTVLKDGKEVSVDPTSCMEAGMPASAFLIIDCPNISHIPSTEASAKFQNILADHGAKLQGVFHLCTREVVTDRDYQSWTQSFGDDVAHYIACQDLCADEVLFAPSALLNLRLQKLDSEIFRIPHYCLRPACLLPEGLPAKTSVLRHSQRISMITSSVLPVQPDIRHFNFLVPSAEAEIEAGRLRVDTLLDCGRAQPTEVYQEFINLAELARSAIVQTEQAKMGAGPQPGDDLVVTTLGTGSASPAKYRNVSATVIEIPRHGFLLLDCGEGTIGQFWRCFGPVEGAVVLQRLRFIFISHLHADHHAGLLGILKARSQLNPRPLPTLFIVGLPGVRIYLEELDDVEGLGIFDANSDIIFIDSIDIRVGLSKRDLRVDRLRDALGFRDVYTVEVMHRTRCLGLVVVHSTGWKLVFSADTMPCEALIHAGSDATLLIHEATMDDDRKQMAEEKGHTTVGQAIEVAVKMRARHCLLTHFSQRYPKIPDLSSHQRAGFAGSPAIAESTPSEAGNDSTSLAVATTWEPVVSIAFDMMSVPVKNLWRMAKYLPAMSVLFAGIEEPDDGGASDRNEAKIPTKAKGKGRTKS